MARPLRIQYPGAVYHVTCRGNEKKDIYGDDDDRKKFLELLTQSINIYSVKLHSYVLMANHFHLLVETPLGNLGEFMRHFNITYTGYYNRRHKRTGHLYQGRYKGFLVDKDAYLSVLSRYIHLNPVRIKKMERSPITKKIKHLTTYPWSSLPGYIQDRKRERQIEYRMILGEYGGDTRKARDAYKERIIDDVAKGIDIRDKITGQSILGGEDFVEWISETFLKGKEDYEQPSLKEIHSYYSKDSILRTIEQETGKKIEQIKMEKGPHRQIAMEMLYRLGGLKGEQIGRIMGVGYTSVSQERRRLRERLKNDRRLENLLNRIEQRCNK